MGLTAFLAMVRKDLLLFFSDRRAVIVAFAVPIFIGSFIGSITGGAELLRGMPPTMLERAYSPLMTNEPRRYEPSMKRIVADCCGWPRSLNLPL